MGDPALLLLQASIGHVGEVAVFLELKGLFDEPEAGAGDRLFALIGQALDGRVRGIVDGDVDSLAAVSPLKGRPGTAEDVVRRLEWKEQVLARLHGA